MLRAVALVFDEEGGDLLITDAAVIVHLIIFRLDSRDEKVNSVRTFVLKIIVPSVCRHSFSGDIFCLWPMIIGNTLFRADYFQHVNKFGSAFSPESVRSFCV